MVIVLSLLGLASLLAASHHLVGLVRASAGGRCRDALALAALALVALALALTHPEVWALFAWGYPSVACLTLEALRHPRAS